MEKMLQILVVLVPAALLGIVGFLALWHKVWGYIKAQLRIKEQVELLRDVAVAMMFIGPSAGLLFGIDEQSSKTFTYVVAVAVFVGSGWIAQQLSVVLHDLRLAQEMEDRQAMARMAQLLRRQSGRKRKSRLKSR